jgi:heme/copper-type cytochrome/quinol oxidase subunit 4
MKMGFKMLCGFICVALLTSLPVTLASTKTAASQIPPESVNLQSIEDPRGTDKVPLIVHENDSPRTPEEVAKELAKEQREKSYRTNEEGIAIFAGICALIQAVILLMQWWMLRRQTNHMITSERAWFVCSAFMVWRRDDIGQVMAVVSFKYKNVGQTPGFIREIGFAVTPLGEGEELPRVPFNYNAADTTEWAEGRGLPIAPRNNMGRRASFTPTQPQLDALKSGTWIHPIPRVFYE